MSKKVLFLIDNYRSPPHDLHRHWKYSLSWGKVEISLLNIEAPCLQEASRRECVTANRILSVRGKTATNLHKWGSRDSPLQSIMPQWYSGHLSHYTALLSDKTSRLQSFLVSALGCKQHFNNWVSTPHLEMWNLPNDTIKLDSWLLMSDQLYGTGKCCSCVQWC